jgi:hypothetical protein
MSQEIQHSLDAAMALAVEHNQSRARLWLPHLSSAWLGVAPRYVLLDSAQDEVAAARDDERDLSSAEASQGVRETEHDVETMRKTPHVSLFTLRAALLREAWSSRRSLKMRLALSGMLRSFRESPHVKHALKNAAGVAALTFPAFLPLGSVGECTCATTGTPLILKRSLGRNWFSAVHGQWMVITYFWILETTTGATWRSGYLRIVSLFI